MVVATGWEKWKTRLPSLAAEATEAERPIAEVIAEHERGEEARLGAHLEACGVPRRDVEILSACATLKDTAAVAGVREWLRSGKTFCLLAGNPGVGKTVAAAAVMKMARKAAYFMGDAGPVATWSYSKSAGLFVRAVELASTSPYAEEGRGHWSKVRRVEWLVIDDLGVERIDNAGIWAEQFDRLIETRYAERRKTVITTNLTGEQVEARYGARTISRIKDDYVAVVCTNDSLRVNA